MPFTDSYANGILNYALAKTAQLTAPSAVYIGLCTNDPEADGGTVREISGGGYARVMLSQKGASYPALIGSASGRSIKNNAQINWTKATADWPRVKGFFLSSSASVGETSAVFFYGKLDLPADIEAAGGLLVEAGAVALFDPNTFKIEFPAADVSA